MLSFLDWLATVMECWIENHIVRVDRKMGRLILARHFDPRSLAEMAEEAAKS